jgi:hypothetical protein
MGLISNYKANVWHNSGVTWAPEGNIDEAISCFANSMQLQTEDKVSMVPHAWYNLLISIRFSKLGSMERAKEAFSDFNYWFDLFNKSMESNTGFLTRARFLGYSVEFKKFLDKNKDHIDKLNYSPSRLP